MSRSLVRSAFTIAILVVLANSSQAQNRMPRNYQELMQMKTARQAAVPPPVLTSPRVASNSPVHVQPSVQRSAANPIQRASHNQPSVHGFGFGGLHQSAGQNINHVIHPTTVSNEVPYQESNAFVSAPSSSESAGEQVNFEYGGRGCDGCASCGVDSGCDTCGSLECGDKCRAFWSCLPRLWLRDLELFAGGQGAVNPRFLGDPGVAPDPSFGIHSGGNWAFRLSRRGQTGQVGIRVIKSNFSDATLTPDTRNQIFTTFGLHQRRRCGLQMGTAVDYLHDEWYIDMNLVQMRSQFSWKFANCREIGFQYAGALNHQRNQGTINNILAGGTQPTDELWHAENNYRFFAQTPLDNGGEGRMTLGFTNRSDFLLDCGVLTPISLRWALRSGCTYLVPTDSDSEVWNVSMSLVFYPRGARSTLCSLTRPMFDVADNGSFLLTKILP